MFDPTDFQTLFITAINDNTAKSFITVDNDDNRIDFEFFTLAIDSSKQKVLNDRKKAFYGLLHDLRNYYCNDLKQLEFVSEFEKDCENYNAKNLIWWYTRETFFYDIVNRCLFSQEINLIDKVKYLISELQIAIKDLAQISTTLTNKPIPSCLYRVTEINQNEIKILKYNSSKSQYIILNNFASFSSKILQQFLKRPARNTVYVIQNASEINNDGVFVYSQPYSYHKNEDEYLFNIGNMFEVINIEDIFDNKYSKNVYYVYLKLVTHKQKLGRKNYLTQIMDEIKRNPEEMYLPIIYFRNLKYTLSEDLIQKYLAKETIPTHIVSAYNYLGMIQHKTCQYTSAFNTYDKALELYFSNNTNNYDDTLLSSIYSNLALVYGAQSNHEKALKFHFIALSIDQKTIPSNENDVLISVTFNNIASTYLYLGDYVSALEYFQKALAIREAVLGESDLKTISTYGNLGSLHSKMSNFSEARKYHQKALKGRQEVLGEKHPETSASWQSLGGLYYLQGDYKQCINHYNEALVIQEHIFTNDHIQIAQLHNNIGLAYFKSGWYEQALIHHEKSLSIKKRILEPDHASISISYNNFGLVYNDIGNYDKALKYFMLSLEIDLKTLSPNHTSLADIYSNIGYAYVNLNKLESAIEFNHKALDIRLAAFKENNVDTATSYNNLGQAHFAKCEYDQALIYFIKALSIRTTLIPSHHETGVTLNNIACVYYATNQFKTAISYALQAVAIQELALAFGNRKLRGTYSNLAKFYRAATQYDKSLEYYEKVLTICKQIATVNSVLCGIDEEIAIVHKNMAEVYYEMGNFTQSANHYEITLSIKQKLLPLHDLEILELRNQLANMNFLSGKDDKKLPRSCAQS